MRARAFVREYVSKPIDTPKSIDSVITPSIPVNS